MKESELSHLYSTLGAPEGCSGSESPARSIHNLDCNRLRVTLVVRELQAETAVEIAKAFELAEVALSWSGRSCLGLSYEGLGRSKMLIVCVKISTLGRSIRNVEMEYSVLIDIALLSQIDSNLINPGLRQS